MKKKQDALRGYAQQLPASSLGDTASAPSREDSSIDIRATVIEGFKKVCWGDKYHESNRPGEEEQVRKEVDDQGRVESREERKARLAREEKAATERYRQEHAAMYAPKKK